MTRARAMALFAIPSFLGGMAANLDLGNTLTMYNESKSEEEADSKAIYSDWAAVGDDIRYALHRWENVYGKQE